MKIDVFDTKGNKTKEISIKDVISKYKPNDEALKQYIRVYQNNQRQGNSSTKTRAEVSGGGKKPWKQKGTGRARAGSSRSPLWVHGGVAHGPKPKDFTLKIPRKMKQSALKTALFYALGSNKVRAIESLDFKEAKTKEALAILKNMKVEGKVTFVLNEKNDLFVLSTRNMPKVKTTTLDILNAYDLVATKNIIFLESCIKELEKKYESK